MFLNKTIERNSELIEATIKLHRCNALLPDTYVVDMDALLSNAAKIKQVAEENKVLLYFMLKQIGRNPDIAKELLKIGYEGVVAVDYWEALSMVKAGIKLGNVGHLVQTPKGALKTILSAKPDIVTVFSLEKAREINGVCRELQHKQKLMLRIQDENDLKYSGQYGGFFLQELPDVINEIHKMENIKIAGLTSFPCMLFDECSQKIKPTPNIKTLQSAEKCLKDMGVEIEQINMPSATCCDSIPLIHKAGGTHGEPGHALTGTTPYHAVRNCDEIPAVVYLTEVSHNHDGYAYCYGGGHYRRSHVENAIVGSLDKNRRVKVIPPTDESIDYYFGLNETAPVSESVVMAFRTQIFVTRSRVALIKGISQGRPEVAGIYTSLGQKLS